MESTVPFSLHKPTFSGPKDGLLTDVYCTNCACRRNGDCGWMEKKRAKKRNFCFRFQERERERERERNWEDVRCWQRQKKTFLQPFFPFFPFRYSMILRNEWMSDVGGSWWGKSHLFPPPRKPFHVASLIVGSFAQSVFLCFLSFFLSFFSGPGNWSEIVVQRRGSLSFFVSISNDGQVRSSSSVSGYGQNSRTTKSGAFVLVCLYVCVRVFVCLYVSVPRPESSGLDKCPNAPSLERGAPDSPPSDWERVSEWVTEWPLTDLSLLRFACWQEQGEITLNGPSAMQSSSSLALVHVHIKVCSSHWLKGPCWAELIDCR